MRRSAPLAVVAAAASVLLPLLGEAAQSGPFVPPPPLRIGVGGDYADGLDGMLAARGFPHERIFPWELSDPEALKRFDLLFLSCPEPLRPGFDEALEEWVRAGGRAYVELRSGRGVPCPLPRYVSVVGPAPEASDAVISDSALALAPESSTRTPVDLYDLTGVLVQAQGGAEARTIAQYCPDGGGDPIQGGAAMLAMPLGQGEVVYSGSPLAFCCFRGEATQPLLGGAIAYLLRERGEPRLTTVAASMAPDGHVDGPDTSLQTAAGSAFGPSRREGKGVWAAGAPTGFHPVDEVSEGCYNVTATLSPAPSDSGPASVLLLDGQAGSGGRPSGSTLWLAFGAKHVEVRAGPSEGGKAVASTAWRPPTQPVELLVRRRPGLVSIVLGDQEVLRAPAKGRPGGLVALKPGMAPLTDAYCQEIGEPAFSDDFMRDPDDPTEWATVSGQWESVGVGHEEGSVNGFFLRGQGGETALAVTGDTYWEDYTASAAVRPESAAACGLGALRQANGDIIAFVADSAPKPWPTLRLLRVVGGRETVLAERTGALASGQWYRLALRMAGGKLEGLVDGEPRVECANPEVRGGGIGLLVRGGAARFDDVLVRPAGEPLRSPGGEGTPGADISPYLGPEDRLTWANPAAVWVASAERPSLLWHQGDFPGDVSVSLELLPEAEPALRRLILAPSDASAEADWLSVTVGLTPGAESASLEFARPGAKPTGKQAALGSGLTLRLARAGGTAQVLWGQSVLYEAQGVGALRRVGLEVDGPPVATQSVQVASAGVADYAFGAAPTDWWSSAGTWEVAARWACDSRWSWFAGWGEDDAAIWNKRPVEGDVTVDYYVAVKMEAPGGDETERCRDLNTVLCGNRSDPGSGYSFILGGDGGRQTQLLRNGVPVAESTSVRVPPGWGVHQEWFHIRAARIGHRVELDLEGRPVFRWEDPEPLPGGYVGLWTHNSGILLSRVTIYR